MTVHDPRSQMIVIDTENYSGNFERDLCAFLTGQMSDMMRGDPTLESYASGAPDRAWWDANVVYENDDDHTIITPVTIYPTPGWFNNGMGGHYRDLPENYEPATQSAVQSMKQYNDRTHAHVRLRMEQNDFEDREGGWTKEACERTLAAAKDMEASAGQHRYPAYQSVAIFVKNPPPQDVIDALFEHLEGFDDVYTVRYGIKHEPLTITGVRLIDPRYGTEQTLSPRKTALTP